MLQAHESLDPLGERVGDAEGVEVDEGGEFGHGLVI
jgi:hypothetical protein